MKISLGIVGAAGRGAAFANALAATGRFKVSAVCDTRAELLPRVQELFDAPGAFADYEAMLDSTPGLQAVLIGTPMPLHAGMAIAALQRGIHVLCEVTAAVNMDEARQLVHAAEGSQAFYMMAENYTFTRANALVRELVRRGFFGKTYYAEGEYLHELKQLNEQTPWRRQWQTGIDGLTYPTHSLGPILQWMPGERIASLCCAGSGHHHRDARGLPYENSDTCVMLGRTTHGGLVKIRVDMLSDRPHAMTNYTLQGTDGAYESARAPGENDRICLRSRVPGMDCWEKLDALQEFAPPLWKRYGELATASGHGGGDFMELMQFADVIAGEAENELGVHAAMDLTLPGLVSQQSIAAGGMWMAVPDSREWISARPPVERQLHMIWPEDRLASPPAVPVPTGYTLRLLRDDEDAALAQLMVAAGFTDWNETSIRTSRRAALAGSYFVVVHNATGRIVATAHARHKATDLHPEGGELSWVAADPAHAGRRLGAVVCSAVVRRFIEMGYRRIYLTTDDPRLPALATYLKLGFRPLEFSPSMSQRWAAVTQQLVARM